MTDPARESSLSPIRLAALGAGVIFVAFIVLLATRDVQRNEPNSAIVGRAVPPVSGVSYDGEPFDIDTILAANRGLAPQEQTWVVVNFFASWCTGCRQEHADLIRFDNEGASCPTQLVGVTFQDSDENVAEYFDDLGGDWPVLVGDTAPMVIDFSVLTAPETIIVAPSGLVANKIIGATTYEQLSGTVAC